MRTKISDPNSRERAQLLEDDRSDSSGQRGLGGKGGFEFLPTMSDEEKIEKWRASWDDNNKKPKQDSLAEREKKIHKGRGARRLRTKLKGTSPLLRVTRLHLSC